MIGLADAFAECLKALISQVSDFLNKIRLFVAIAIDADECVYLRSQNKSARFGALRFLVRRQGTTLPKSIPNRLLP